MASQDRLRPLLRSSLGWSRPLRTSGESRHHLLGQELDLKSLLAQRPHIDALAAGLLLAAQKLDDATRRADAELVPQLGRLSS